jgi:hypothetical protein
MSILVFAASATFALFLLFFAIAASRRRGGERASGTESSYPYSDGGNASFSDSGVGNCDSGGSDGGGSCDGGGGGGD